MHWAHVHFNTSSDFGGLSLTPERLGDGFGRCKYMAPRKPTGDRTSSKSKKVSKEEAFLREVDSRLAVYGNNRHYNRDDVLEELVFIILSAQTESYLYRQTFEDLRERFPTWESMLEAAEEEIEAAIRRGGLARKKASQLKRALEKIKADTGALSLDFLQDLSDEDALRYLTSLAGIGNKSAACIMMYSLDRQVFPVDTHVWRVCRRLGLTPPVPKPTDAQERELESRVPEGIRYSLHVNMVSHGQQTCTTYWPKCDSCVLADICPSRGKPDQVWGQWRRPSGVWAKALDNVDSSKTGNKN
jgi:endonuclease III